MGKRHFHITIGASPFREAFSNSGAAKHVIQARHELGLIKSGLLYADRVTLCSPISVAFSPLLALPRFGREERLEMFRQLIPTIKNRLSHLDPVAVETLALNYIEAASKSNPTASERALVQSFESNMAHMLQGFSNMARQFLDSHSEFKELTRAVGSGLLELKSFGMGRSLGESAGRFLNDMYVRSKTPEDIFEPSFINDIFWDLCDEISKAVQSPTSYPLLDDTSGEIVKILVDRAEISLSQQHVARAQHIGLAAGLLERLPQFESAKVDEILDIRRELSQPLVRFRSAVMGISTDFKAASWDAGFALEVEAAFRQQIEPTVQELEESVTSNKYLLELAQLLPERALLVPGGSALGMALSNFSSLPEIFSQLLGVGAGASLLAGDAYKKWRQKHQEHQGHQLFFYYSAKRKLTAK